VEGVSQCRSSSGGALADSLYQGIHAQSRRIVLTLQNLEPMFHC